MPSIAAIANVYNDAQALPGFLESAAQWADHITIYHTGPQGERSTDGTIEIAEKWGVDLQWGSIDEGFGAVRSRMVTMTPCDWVFIMDADERFFRVVPRLTCEGTESYPQVTKPNLTVTQHGAYDQLALLKSLMTPDADAIRTCRRHWFNHHWDAACQNWQINADWQLRVLRNCDWIGYNPAVAMHEQIWDRRTGGEPRFRSATPNEGPYHDHFHCFYKAMETEQRQHDIRIYDAIHERRTPPTLEEFRAQAAK